MVTLSKIYDEKEQVEQGQLQNVNFKRKREARTRMDQNHVFKKINSLRNVILGVVNSEARSHSVKFPTCEKELRKS